MGFLYRNAIKTKILIFPLKTNNNRLFYQSIRDKYNRLLWKDNLL